MKRQLGDPVIKFFISVVGIVLIVLVLKELQHIFIPFVLAYLLFFIFEPLNSFLKKHKIPSGVSTIIDITIIASIFWGISRVIITSFTQFGEEMPIYESRLNNIVGSTFKTIGITDPALINFNLSEILQNLDYGGLASGFFTSTISLFSTVFFILFFFIFISSGHAKIYEAIKRRYVESNVKSSVKQIRKQLKTEVSEEDADDINVKLSEMKSSHEAIVEQTFRVITEQIQRYIATKFLISLTTGVLVGIILWIFGVDFVIVWAFLTTMLNFIPNIGSSIAVILPTLMTLVQFESIGYTLLIGGIIAFIQNVIGNIIEPKIFGDRLGLNPIVILISLLVWGYIWGIIGMFLSVPLTAVIKIIISNSKSKNLKFISDLMAN